MHSTSRRLVFYLLVTSFIVGGFYAVFSVFGLTIDTGGTFVRTGSLFVAAVPRDADLFLEDTLAEERPGFLSGGTLVKNLAPRTYEVRVEREGRVPWRAALPITSGLVTRATDVFLWPREASSTLFALRVDSFSLSAGIPLMKISGGGLFLEKTRVPGEEIEYASNDSATLITRSGNTLSWVRTGPASATVNLTALFHTLKERDLKLPGIVPLTAVRPHPFSAGKFLITTETSLYMLDTRRISLERLVTINDIAATDFGETEVLLLSDDGDLTAVDLVFKTVDTVPFVSSTIARFARAADGAAIVTLTEGKTLTAYERATGAHITIAENVSEFSIAPGSVRLAYVSGGSIAVYFLGTYAGDTFIPRGHVITVWEGNTEPRGLAWNSALPRYLFFLEDGALTALEVGFYGERNNVVLAEGVRDFTVAGYSAYVLKNDDTLLTLSFEE
ncbi:MAG: hypothetical protein Q8P88_02260 [Candidatus Jorgensenbacteria bacterium]|nr:hypothetical protein [Candidatus Jorgensenbacteria bacterium]